MSIRLLVRIDKLNKCVHANSTQMGYIYILTSPIGKSYIGQTTVAIEKRFIQHQYPSSGCRAIYNAIQKYGWDSFEKDWYECPNEDLDFDEELLVREIGTLSPGGYNLKGGGGSNGKHSEESKLKMSEDRKGEKSHMYGKTGEKHNFFGKTHTEETKQKMSEAQRGEKGTMYGKTGEKHPMYGKTGEKHPMSKKVYQYDLQGNFIRSFGSGNEAVRYLRKTYGTAITNGSSISQCASGNPKNKSAYGFKWSRVMVD